MLTETAAETAAIIIIVIFNDFFIFVILPFKCIYLLSKLIVILYHIYIRFTIVSEKKS